LNPPAAPLHHSLVLSASSADPQNAGQVAFRFEFTIFRSRNGFHQGAECAVILERRGNSPAEFQRVVMRKALPFPQPIPDSEALITSAWSCESIQFEPRRFSGSFSTAEGTLDWNLDASGGHEIEYRPVPWLSSSRTRCTQIPLQGSWRFTPASSALVPMDWNASQVPVRAALQSREEAVRVLPSLWFHSQSLRETGTELLHCAEGLQVQTRLPLTGIAAFDRLKGNPSDTLWSALRSRLSRNSTGWTFRMEQSGRELRGRIEVDPRHWVTLRHEDVRGRSFFRTTARMARLEILVLDHGRPQGLFSRDSLLAPRQKGLFSIRIGLDSKHSQTPSSGPLNHHDHFDSRKTLDFKTRHHRLGRHR